MLKLEWAGLTDDFNELFAGFIPLNPAGGLIVETLLRLWIFEFGRTNMKYQSEWTSVMALFNSGSFDWTKVLGWGGATPGFFDGTTAHTFPIALKNRINIDSADLAAFNTWSTVCATSGCGRKTSCCATPQFTASNCCLN